MRLTVVQPTLAAYRVPVFRELARRPGVDLLVVHGRVPDLPNAPADGFDALEAPIRRGSVLGHPFYFNASFPRHAHPRQSDVIVTTWDAHYLDLIPGLALARRRKVGTVVWGHGYSRRDTRLRLAARKLPARLADSALFYTETGRRRFIDAGFGLEKLFVAPNALDGEPMRRAAELWHQPGKLDAWQKLHGLGTRPAVLFVSRLSQPRRVDLLIDAAALLRRDGVDLDVLLVGDGDAALVEQLRARADANGVRAHFAGAVYGEDALAPYFLTAQIFCFPRFMGLAAQHAMNYALPVVTTDDFDANNPEAEAVLDNRTGLLYRDGDAADLAAQLARLLADPAFARQLGDAGLERCRTTYNVPTMVDGILAAARHAHESVRSRP